MLQETFERQCPQGWTCRHEVRLLSKERSELLGFSPRVDVLLENHDVSRRVWVEFEVSRADPVANHAKFATAHLFEPQPSDDAFVAMVSAHVAPGRRNLAACMVDVMRRLGMNAFHTVLLPTLAAADIKRLNHSGLDTLRRRITDLGAEVECALTVSEPLGRVRGREVYFAGNMFEVSENVRQWNRDMENPANRELWGRRTVTYFVVDPATRSFAPAKFCAYQPVGHDPDAALDRGGRSGMTVSYYSEVDQKASLFDGAQARQHLVRRLGMALLPVSEMDKDFRTWIRGQGSAVRIHPSGHKIIAPVSTVPRAR